MGALYGEGGSKFINWGHVTSLWQASGVMKVVMALFLSPLIGFVAGFMCLAMLVVILNQCSMRARKPLYAVQWLMTGLLAFGHGANDPQKSMGVMMLAIHAMFGRSTTDIPVLVRLAAGLAIGAGILSLAPGIVRRVGAKIYKLRNVHAAAVEMASALVVVGGSMTGGPVSASQVISSSVVGVGTAVRPKRLGWLVVRDMLIAWCLTIPCSGMLACGLHLIGHQLFNLVAGWK
jgi:PiT family inorganic phosphate transporter